MLITDIIMFRHIGASKQLIAQYLTQTLLHSPHPSLLLFQIFGPYSFLSSKNSKLVCLKDHHGDHFLHLLWVIVALHSHRIA